tara:strand:- start:1170 stop:1343 length:174 start_codon:yes stop_codon:yes gene_type:complete
MPHDKSIDKRIAERSLDQQIQALMSRRSGGHETLLGINTEYSVMQVRKKGKTNNKIS